MVAHRIGETLEASGTVLADPSDRRGGQIHPEEVGHQFDQTLLGQQLVVQEIEYEGADPRAVLHGRSDPFGKYRPGLSAAKGEEGGGGFVRPPTAASPSGATSSAIRSSPPHCSTNSCITPADHRPSQPEIFRPALLGKIQSALTASDYWTAPVRRSRPGRTIAQHRSPYPAALTLLRCRQCARLRHRSEPAPPLPRSLPEKASPEQWTHSLLGSRGGF